MSIKVVHIKDKLPVNFLGNSKDAEFTLDEDLLRGIIFDMCELYDGFGMVLCIGQEYDPVPGSGIVFKFYSKLGNNCSLKFINPENYLLCIDPVTGDKYVKVADDSMSRIALKLEMVKRLVLKRG